MRTAARLCPDAIFVPVDGRKYSRVSREVMAILRRYTPAVEQISIDEAFLDVAGSEALHGTPLEMAGGIKGAIAAELMSGIEHYRAGVARVPGLRVLGDPELSIISVAAAGTVRRSSASKRYAGSVGESPGSSQTRFSSSRRNRVPPESSYAATCCCARRPCHTWQEARRAWP